MVSKVEKTHDGIRFKLMKKINHKLVKWNMFNVKQ